RERGAVVLALVAEKRAESFVLPGLRDQHVPIEVSAFVAEMAEQGAIGLAELLAPALSLDGIGFEDVDGDDAIEMAGRGVDEEIEREALAACSRRVERQSEAQEVVQEPLLGALQLLPG